MCVPVGGVEPLDVELNPRLGHEHLGDVLEEGDPVLLGADVVVDVRALVEPLHEPVEAVRDELEVGVAKVFDGDDARVAQRAHALRKVCELEEGRGGVRTSSGYRGRSRWENGTMGKKVSRLETRADASGTGRARWTHFESRGTTCRPTNHALTSRIPIRRRRRSPARLCVSHDGQILQV